MPTSHRHLVGTIFLALSAPLLIAAAPVQVAVYIATDETVPVVDTKWVDERLKRADNLFAVTKLRFQRIATSTAALVNETGDIMSVRERHALAQKAPTDGRIHIFIVDKLADKDRKGGFISGVHWRYAGGKRRWRGRRYIILSKWSAIDTLAHELGHFFGLPHTRKTQTLMTSPGRITGAKFTRRQLRIIKWNYKRYLRSKRLRRPPRP